jgi:hypothetical protein
MALAYAAMDASRPVVPGAWSTDSCGTSTLAGIRSNASARREGVHISQRSGKCVGSRVGVLAYVRVDAVDHRDAHTAMSAVAHMHGRHQ